MSSLSGWRPIRYLGELWFKLLLAFVALAVGLVAVKWLSTPQPIIRVPVARVAQDPGKKSPEGVLLIDGIDVRNGDLRVRGARLQSFTVELRKTGGYLSHRILSDGISSEASGAFSTRIAGASGRFTRTPAVSELQGFSAGVGTLKLDGSFLLFDTVEQAEPDLAGIAIVEGGTVARDVSVVVGLKTLQVARARRRCLVFRLRNRDDKFVAWSSVLGRENDSLRVHFLGFIR